ncbi:MAG TPA: hypothetical protein VHE54_08600 [Puia sp.]|nr:hypothetical protein [Puia sp.]
MSTGQPYAAVAALAFFWCGAVASISFLEAWLKFKAPGVTIPVGLSIGRRVFSALNKVEWVLAAGSAACGFLGTGGWRPGMGWLIAAIAILLIETVWLLPVLDRRAAAYIQGYTPPSSTIHVAFVTAELLKVGCLALAGITILKLL